MKLFEAQKRIEEIKKVKVSFTIIGNALGVSKQRAFQLKEVELKSDQINLLEDYFQINLLNKENIDESSNADECINLPLITASAGGGYSVLENQKIGICKAELMNVGFQKSDNLVAVKVSGMSMQPTINNGDVLILNTKFEKIIDNDIYVLSYGGELFCKRLLRGLTYLVVKSDNADYPLEKIEGQEQEKLNVIGKVIFRMNGF